MASSLIDLLNANAHLTPDEIVAIIDDPFPTWGQGNRVTQQLLDQYSEMRIVICYGDEPRRSNPTHRNCEMSHKLATQENTYEFNRWRYEDYQGPRGILRSGGDFWFRSLKSFEANPGEGF